MDMEMTMTYAWDVRLVVLSYIVASVASFAALTLAGRVRFAAPETRLAWLGGSAFTMGIGIWSMHFVGMLAMKMNMPMSYDLGVTALSVLAAFVASAIAFHTISGESLGVSSLLIAGLFMGSGVAAMHYIGMAAMRMPADISYDPLLFALSIAIAVVASIAAMILFYYLNLEATTARFGVRVVLGFKGVAALVMGVAVIGMHYTGMFAARYTPNESIVTTAGAVDPDLLAILVSAATFAIVGIALVIQMNGVTEEEVDLEFQTEF